MEKYYTKNSRLLRKNKNHIYKFENDAFYLDIILSNYCDRSSVNYEYSQVMHAHSYYEMQIILEGECNFESSSNQQFTVKSGEFILFTPQYKHRITKESDKFKKISVAFGFMPKETDTKNFYEVAKKIAENPVVLKSNQEISNHCNSMIYNINKRPHEYKNIIYLSTIQLIIEVLRLIVGDAEIERNESINDNRVKLATEYIKANISATLNVKNVADYVHLSSKQLSRIFVKEIGITPTTYIKNQKISCIRDMLINDFNINDIVDTMGYPDSTSMIKAFKRFSGITPSKYKKSISLKKTQQDN